MKKLLRVLLRLIANVVDAALCGDLPFKNAPTSYNVDSLVAHARNGGIPASSQDGNTWVLARSLGYFSLIRRTKLAWQVFTGKADVLTWSQGQ